MGLSTRMGVAIASVMNNIDRARMLRIVRELDSECQGNQVRYARLARAEIKEGSGNMQEQENNSAEQENGIVTFISRLPTKPFLNFAPIEVKPVGDSPS